MESYSTLDELIAAERARRSGSLQSQATDDVTPSPPTPPPDPEIDSEAEPEGGEAPESPVTADPVVSAEPALHWTQTPEGRAKMSKALLKANRRKRQAMLRELHVDKKANGHDKKDRVRWSAAGVARRKQTMLDLYGTLAPKIAHRLKQGQSAAPAAATSMRKGTILHRLTQVLPGRPPLLVSEIERLLNETGEQVKKNSLSARIAQLVKSEHLIKSADQPSRYSLSDSPFRPMTNTKTRAQPKSRAEQAIEAHIQTAAPRQERPEVSALARRAIYRAAIQTAFEHRELDLVLAEIGMSTLTANHE